MNSLDTGRWLSIILSVYNIYQIRTLDDLSRKKYVILNHLCLFDIIIEIVVND